MRLFVSRFFSGFCCFSIVDRKWSLAAKWACFFLCRFRRNKKNRYLLMLFSWRFSHQPKIKEFVQLCKGRMAGTDLRENHGAFGQFLQGCLKDQHSSCESAEICGNMWKLWKLLFWKHENSCKQFGTLKRPQSISPQMIKYCFLYALVTDAPQTTSKK